MSWIEHTQSSPVYITKLLIQVSQKPLGICKSLTYIVASSNDSIVVAKVSIANQAITDKEFKSRRPPRKVPPNFHSTSLQQSPSFTAINQKVKNGRVFVQGISANLRLIEFVGTSSMMENSWLRQV